jgi:hypothetical protein
MKNRNATTHTITIWEKRCQARGDKVSKDTVERNDTEEGSYGSSLRHEEKTNVNDYQTVHESEKSGTCEEGSEGYIKTNDRT